jgi:hypothetical protein
MYPDPDPLKTRTRLWGMGFRRVYIAGVTNYVRHPSRDRGIARDRGKPRDLSPSYVARDRGNTRDPGNTRDQA